MKNKLHVLQVNDVPKGLDYKEIKRILREIENKQGPVKFGENELFFKRSDVFSNNDREELLYQFKWLKKSRGIKGVNVPKPLVFVKLGEITGYIMERVNGKNLEELIKTNTPELARNFSQIIKKVLKQINILHREGMQHGDIDERNILLDDKGEVFLIDPYKHDDPGVAIVDDIERLRHIESTFSTNKR